jgi:guanylate kinase
VVYKFFLGDEEYPLVSITKVETNKEDEDETIHELSFYLSEQGTALNVNLDETLLFDEEIDLQDNLKKKMQVMDKMNKFIFLLSEEARKLEKELREKEAEEQEKRKLQDIFRNF